MHTQDPIRSLNYAADRQFGITPKMDKAFIRLRHPSGLYLNINGTGLTDRSDFGGCYSARPEQVEAMRRQNALAAECREA